MTRVYLTHIDVDQRMKRHPPAAMSTFCVQSRTHVIEINPDLSLFHFLFFFPLLLLLLLLLRKKKPHITIFSIPEHAIVRYAQVYSIERSILTYWSVVRDGTILIIGAILILESIPTDESILRDVYILIDGIILLIYTVII